MSARAHNFFAGPAILPVPVLEETGQAVSNFANTGVSLMEISHRSKEFEAIMNEAQADALALMNLSPMNTESSISAAARVCSSPCCQ